MPRFTRLNAMSGVHAVLVLAVLQTCPAWSAEIYPARPIRFVITFPPGGAADAIARAMQPSLERALGQPIIVDNRPGAGGVIGIDAVAKSAPDGYVIGLGAAGALAINVSIKEKMPYDPLTQLAPVSMVAHVPFILIAPSNSSTGSLRDVIALAKAKPDGLSIGHGGNGTGMHLTAQLLNHMAGVNIPLVPYRGSGPVAQDVLAAHVPFGITDIASALSLIQAGRVKALAVSSARRVPSLPDVPTFAEAALPEYESIGWFGVVAPAATPPAVVAKLNAAIVAALNDPAIQQNARNVGAEPAPGTPAQFSTFIQSEIAKWAKVVSETGAR